MLYVRGKCKVILVIFNSRVTNTVCGAQEVRILCFFIIKLLLSLESVGVEYTDTSPGFSDNRVKKADYISAGVGSAWLDGD